MCVLVFARYGDTRLGAAALVRQILSNPLVVACALGIAMQAGGISFPAAVAPAVRARRRVDAAWPAVRGRGTEIRCGAGMAAAGVRRVGVQVHGDAAHHARRRPPARAGDAALTVALLFQALPTSSASHIMARQLGGDAPLMAGITAFQTVAAALAMPVVLSALASAPGFR